MVRRAPPDGVQSDPAERALDNVPPEGLHQALPAGRQGRKNSGEKHHQTVRQQQGGPAARRESAGRFRAGLGESRHAGAVQVSVRGLFQSVQKSHPKIRGGEGLRRARRNVQAEADVDVTTGGLFKQNPA
uniref:(northern house mosquito) hypothetical protein n=1 Tax=Culex pipiens TaxID=7175 RepID=A0A8D8BFL6_CULPI